MGAVPQTADCPLTDPSPPGTEARGRAASCNPPRAPGPPGELQEEAPFLSRPGIAGAAQRGRECDPPQPEARPTFCPSPGFIRRRVSASCDCGQVVARFPFLLFSPSDAGRLCGSVGGGWFSAGKVCGGAPQSRQRGRAVQAWPAGKGRCPVWRRAGSTSSRCW